MQRLLMKEIRAEDDEVVRMHDVLEKLYPSLCNTGSAEERALFKQNYPTLEDLRYHLLYKTYKSRIQTLQNKFEEIGGKTHLWVGINPPPEKYTLKQLYDKMIDISENPKIKFFRDSYIWNVEQNTQNGIRPHIHLILTDATVRPSRVIETLAKSFDIAKNSIQCKRHFNGIMYNEHIDYIKGKKTDSKQEDVGKDIADRMDLDINDYIGQI